MADVNSVPANEVISQNNQEQRINENEDTESIKGIFFWKAIARYHVPYIIRVINGEKFKFVSVRMAETQLLSYYMPYLHPDIYTCISVKSHFITDSEAKLLNDINIKHCDGIYGKDTFYAGKDYIVHLEDVIEFYTYIEVCYNKVLSNINPDCIEKCGFIRINSDFVVPYCLLDGRKYLPLFYFEGETECQRQRAIKLEDWNLAYLKFCCKVQDIKNELYTFDSCTATTLDDIKNNFPPKTHFEEYWPAKVINKNLLINQKAPHVHPSGVWIRAPPEEPAPNSIIQHSLTASAPVMPQDMPVLMNTFQNGQPANQMGPPMSQGNCLMNGGSHVKSPPPLVHVNNTAPVIGNTVSYSNTATVPISQCMTTMYNPVPSSSVMSNSNQMQQFYNQCPSNNSQDQQQQPQPQQQIITTPQVQPHSGPTSVHNRLTNTQQRNALRNVAPVIITPATEIIVLSSSPSSSAFTPVQDAPLRHNFGFEFQQIPERMLAQDSESTNNSAYKIQKAIINGRMIHCINAKPYIYSDLMVTLVDLIQMLLPSCTVTRCAHVLYKCLNITLFHGNSEQMDVLRESLSSIYAKDTPMVMLQDIMQVLPQLKNLLSKQDQSAAGSSKILHTS